MKSNFEISERIGFGPILFGMSRAEVRNVLGEPDWFESQREEYLQGFVVHYDLAQTVEFIELAPSELFNVTLRGTNLHKATAGETVAFVSQFDAFDPGDIELGHSYIFPKLELSLWRSTIPESFTDTDGMYFEAVGVGKPGYFSS